MEIFEGKNRRDMRLKAISVSDDAIEVLIPFSYLKAVVTNCNPAEDFVAIRAGTDYPMSIAWRDKDEPTTRLICSIAPRIGNDEGTHEIVKEMME